MQLMLSGHIHVKLRGSLLRQMHPPPILIVCMMCLFIRNHLLAGSVLCLMKRDKHLIHKRLLMDSSPAPVSNVVTMDIIESRI